MAVAIGVAALFPMPRYIARGWYDGESFYRWRPTRYWADELLRVTDQNPSPGIREWGGRVEVKFDESPELGDLLSCQDPDSLKVIWELISNHNLEVRRCFYGGFLAQRYQARKNGQPAANVEKTLPLFTYRVQILVNRRFDEEVHDAMHVLATYGPEGIAALPFLVMNLQLPDPGMRLQAAESIFHIDPKVRADALEVFTEAMDEGPAERAKAIKYADWYARRAAIMRDEVPAERREALVKKILAILPKVKESGDAQCLDDVKDLLNRLDPEAAAKAGMK
jgi:hypothetical protein